MELVNGSGIKVIGDEEIFSSSFGEYSVFSQPSAYLGPE